MSEGHAGDIVSAIERFIDAKIADAKTDPGSSWISMEPIRAKEALFEALKKLEE